MKIDGWSVFVELANLSEKLADPKSFPALPEVVSDLIHEIDLGVISVSNLGKMLQKDVGLATQIIRHANTGAYIGSGQVTTIDQAIRLIGFRMLKGLCLTLPLFSQVRHVTGIDMIWYHSRISALCGKIIAKKIAFSEEEEAETAGLLHDIGKIFLAIHEKSFLTEQTQLADQTDRETDWEVERRVLGVDHCFIGARYGRMFNFPQTIIDCLLWHHEPHKTPAHHVLVHLVGLSDKMAVIVGAEHPDDLFVEPSLLISLDFLGINRAMFREILEEVLEKIQSVTFVDLG